MSRLTHLKIKGAGPGRYADGGGLYLLVKPSGSKSWVLRVQVNGRRRDFGLGSLAWLSLSEAREKARQGRKMAKEGLDPSQEWAKTKTILPTFKDAALAFHSTLKGSWRNKKHADQWINTLEAYAFPLIGSLQVDQVESSQIQSVLIPIWTEKPETARRLRQRVAKVLDYAFSHGWRKTEAPMRAVNSVMKSIKQPKSGNFAAMPYASVPAFMMKLGEMEESVGRQALAFLILTAARSGEVRGATWDEIDLEAATWTIPASRMKMNELHSVPLSEAATRILTQAGPKRDGLIFAGQKLGKPLSDMTLSKALRSAGGEPFTVHGFRSSFRDWVAEQTRYPGEWAEAALAHAVSNRVEAAYRRTKFVEQRRALMRDWSTYVADEQH